MLPPGLSFQNLEILALVDQCGSFTSAAKVVSLSTPSVRDHIAALEQALGAPLVDRTPRGTLLTPQGRQVLKRGREIIESAERLQEFCLAAASASGGVLSIACYPVHLERFLAAVLGEFRQLMPDVKLDLTRVRDDRRRNLGRSLFDEMRHGDVELAMGPPQPTRDLSGIHLYDAKIVLMLPNEDLNRHRSSVSVRVLKGRPVLAAPRDYFSREKVVQACKAEGFDLIVEIESASPPALIALGANGVGLPVLPDDYAGARDDRFPYPVLTQGEEELSTPVGLQWFASRSLSPPAEAFVAIARRRAEAEGFGDDIYRHRVS